MSKSCCDGAADPPAYRAALKSQSRNIMDVWGAAAVQSARTPVPACDMDARLPSSQFARLCRLVSHAEPLGQTILLVHADQVIERRERHQIVFGAGSGLGVEKLLVNPLQRLGGREHAAEGV